MKILHVISSCDPNQGGPIEGIKQLYKKYKKNKIEVNILSLDDYEAKFLKDKNLPKVFALGKGFLNYGFNLNFKKWLNENIIKYDKIIVDGIWQYHDYCVWKIATKKKVPYYIFTHGMLDPWFNKNYFFKYVKKLIYWKLFQHKILTNAKKVLFTTNLEKNLAKKSFFPNNFDSSVVGYGSFGNPYLKNSNNMFSKKYKKFLNKKKLLFLGRIVEKKGLDILINSLSKINYKEFHLFIVGNNKNSYSQKIKKLIIKHNLENYVTWTGPLFNKDKWDAFKTADLFCLPSHQENFGISVVEALSSGTPVLISNKVNIYNVIKKYNSGFIHNDNINGTVKSLNNFSNLFSKKFELGVIKKNSLICFKNEFHINSIFFKLKKIIKKN